MSSHHCDHSTELTDDNFSTLLNTSYKLQKQQMCFEFKKHLEISISEISISSSSQARYIMLNLKIYYNLKITLQDTHISIHQQSASLKNEFFWKLQNEWETRIHKLKMMKMRLELAKFSDIDSIKLISFCFKLFEFKKKNQIFDL